MDKIGIGRRPTSSWLGQTPASPTVNRFQKLGRVGAVFNLLETSISLPRPFGVSLSALQTGDVAWGGQLKGPELFGAFLHYGRPRGSFFIFALRFALD
jgi:hypothetical protein